MEIRTLRYFLAVAREEVISGDSIPEAGISLFFFLHRANSIRFASPLSFPRIWLSNLVIVESAETIPIIVLARCPEKEKDRRKTPCMGHLPAILFTRSLSSYIPPNTFPQ